jgi:hypothetical protein
VIKKIFKNQFLEICRKRVWAIPENWKFSGQTVVTEARWDPKHWSNSGQTLVLLITESTVSHGTRGPQIIQIGARKM